MVDTHGRYLAKGTTPMTIPSAQSNSEQNTDQSSMRVIGDIFLVAAPIVILGAVGNLLGLSTLIGGASVNLGYVLAVVIGAVLLRRRDSSWIDIGLQRPSSWPRTFLLGVAAFLGAVVVFVAAQAVAAALFSALGLTAADLDQSRFNPVQGNLPLFLLMVTLAWTTIAFGEELFYRAFFISCLVDHTAIGSGMAIVISSALFGLVHFAEGPVGIVSNGAFGLLFGWIYVRSGRNLWITIIGHALLNTLRFALLYAGAV